MTSHAEVRHPWSTITKLYCIFMLLEELNLAIRVSIRDELKFRQPKITG